MERTHAFESDLSRSEPQAYHLLVKGLGPVTNLLSFGWPISSDGDTTYLED